MNDSFLPVEYTEQRRDRRTHILAMLLFIIVMSGVVSAFFWKRTEWRKIEQVRQDVERRYEAAGIEVAQLMVLQQAQQATVEKAELAAALVEKVPRSILLAELINHMPPGLGLHELKLESTRIIIKPDPKDKNKHKGRTATRDAEVKGPPQAPIYDTRLSLTGFAATDVHVSEFLSALNDHVLFQNVNLVSSQENISDNQVAREFKIRMGLRQDADSRSLAGRWSESRDTSESLAEVVTHE